MSWLRRRPGGRRLPRHARGRGSRRHPALEAWWCWRGVLCRELSDLSPTGQGKTGDDCELSQRRHCSVHVFPLAWIRALSGSLPLRSGSGCCWCVPCGYLGSGPATGENGQNHPAAAATTKDDAQSHPRTPWNCSIPAPRLATSRRTRGWYAPRARVSSDDLDSSIGPRSYSDRAGTARPGSDVDVAILSQDLPTPRCSTG